jgi:hypothetical protein
MSNFMLVEKAAETLHNTLQEYDWLFTVGVGEKGIIVYTNKKLTKAAKQAMIPSVFEHYEVSVEVMGKVKPCLKK